MQENTMAYSAATSFISSKPRAMLMPCSVSTQTLTIPSSFSSFRKPLRSVSLARGSHSRKTFLVKARSGIPLVGSTAPDFEAEAVFDEEFIKLKLSEYIGKKYVILLLYPLELAFVSPTEITAFIDRYPEFQKLNTEILTVSVDTVFTHMAWVQTDRRFGGLGDLKFPLISDVTKSIAKSYGVLIPDQGIALRGLFIIDKEGVIQQSTINNLVIGCSVDDTLITLQALQYMQGNPDDVCTAGWKSGEKSTKLPSLSRPKHLHSPILSIKSVTHLPPIPRPPKITQIPAESPSSIPEPHSEFQEKMLYLDSIGIDFLSLITDHPPIISATLTDIKSAVDLMTSMNFTSFEFRRIVSMCPEILTSQTSDILPVFTFLLREVKVNGSDLKKVINRRPRLLACSVKTRMRPTLYFLQSMGISEVNKHTYLLSCSVEDKLIPRMEYFQKIGFSHKETTTMFRRFPQLFNYSIKDNYEPKLNYFVVEMGRDLKELKELPQYFSFSLENRIKPRHRCCVEKGVCFPLNVLLKTSEKQFLHRLDVCCNTSMPLSTSPLSSIKCHIDFFDRKTLKKCHIDDPVCSKFVVLYTVAELRFIVHVVITVVWFGYCQLLSVFCSTRSDKLFSGVMTYPYPPTSN